MREKVKNKKDHQNVGGKKKKNERVSREKKEKNHGREGKIKCKSMWRR